MPFLTLFHLYFVIPAQRHLFDFCPRHPVRDRLRRLLDSVLRNKGLYPVECLDLSGPEGFSEDWPVPKWRAIESWITCEMRCGSFMVWIILGS